jgi:branched-chain amino acid transport system substrate-binding protein
MRKYQKIASLIIAFGFIFLTSCHKENKDENKVIRIGALVPLTGTASSSGEATSAALTIALQEINQYLGGIKSEYQLEVSLEDTGTDTLISIQQYNMLKGEGIRLVIGPYSSAEVNAIKPLADKDGVLLVSPSSVATSLAIPGDNIFRLVPSDFGQGEAMTALLNDDSIDLLLPVVRDDLWGNELLDATTLQFKNTGKEVLQAVKYAPDATDFDNVVTSLSDKLNDALSMYPLEKIGIYLISFGEGTSILKAASSDEALNTVRWYGSSAFAENKSLVEDHSTAGFASARNLACPIFGYDPNAKAKWQPLVDELRTGLGREPEIYSLVAYDALWLATLTYLNTGEDPDINSLKEAFLVQANNYYGATGWTTLNDAGDRTLATYDFWGITWQENVPVWDVVASYNNATKELVRY